MVSRRKLGFNCESHLVALMPPQEILNMASPPGKSAESRSAASARLPVRRTIALALGRLHGPQVRCTDHAHSLAYAHFQIGCF